MESTSKVGKIQCSDVAAALLGQQAGTDVVLTKRGEIDVKGKGKMTTYWVSAAMEGEFSSCIHHMRNMTKSTEFVDCNQCRTGTSLVDLADDPLPFGAEQAPDVEHGLREQETAPGLRASGHASAPTTTLDLDYNT